MPGRRFIITVVYETAQEGSMYPRIILITLILFGLNLSQAISSEIDGNFAISLTGNTAPGVASQVSVKTIESIGVVEIEAFNPYDKRTDKYTGVWLDQIIARFGRAGTKKITLKAIDDYEIKFMASEWEKIRTLMATRVNGKYIGFAQKGPMRIVFPDYDKNKKIYRDNMAKWIWMITQIDFQ